MLPNRELLRELQSGKAQYKGRMSDEDMEMLLGAALQSPLFSEKEKPISDSMSGEQLKLYLDHNKVVKRCCAEMGISKQLLNQYFTVSKYIHLRCWEAAAKGLNTLPEAIYAETERRGS